MAQEQRADRVVRGQLRQEGRGLRELHLLPQLRGGRHQLLQRHHHGVCQERVRGPDQLLVPGEKS